MKTEDKPPVVLYYDDGTYEVVRWQDANPPWARYLKLSDTDRYLPVKSSDARWHTMKAFCFPDSVAQAVEALRRCFLADPKIVVDDVDDDGHVMITGTGWYYPKHHTETRRSLAQAKVKECSKMMELEKEKV